LHFALSFDAFLKAAVFAAEANVLAVRRWDEYLGEVLK
jgi:hypothetical protein